MRYGLMSYDLGKGHFNVGDYIQSLAARQFLPRVDDTINREGLHRFSGPATKMIVNGWFMHHPKHWPPAQSIAPLFVSLHLTRRAAAVMLNDAGVAYLQPFEVGARDLSTLALLRERGVKAYFSGCLTMTLGRTYRHCGGTDVYFVDALYKPRFFGRRRRILRSLFGSDVVGNATHLTHRYQIRDYPTEQARFALAERLLRTYQNAQCVVTSRLHCALPCLAMGTPVLYVDVGVPKEQGRFDGLRELLHTVDASAWRGKAPYDLGALRNKTEHTKYVDVLEQKCRDFIRG